MGLVKHIKKEEDERGAEEEVEGGQEDSWLDRAITVLYTFQY